jgi:hypothetical protein
MRWPTGGAGGHPIEQRGTVRGGTAHSAATIASNSD